VPAKRDRDATHANKLLRLFAKLFFNDREYTLPELARMLDCSKQTVMRLVEAIEESMSVEVVRGERGRSRTYRLPRQKSLPTAKVLHHEELQALYMCAAFAQSVLGRELFEEASLGLEKTQLLLPSEAHTAEGHFATLSGGRIDYGPHRETLRLLIEAMESGHVCELLYQRLLDDEARSLRIKPLKIFSYRDSIYLHTRRAPEPGKAWKEPEYHPLLAVHRIQQVRITEQHYRVPEDYDFDRDVKTSFGVWQNEPFRVVCRFEGWAAEYVAEREWSVDQEIEIHPDDTVTLTFTARGRPEVVAWILGFGANAEVLGPDDLVGEVASELSKAMKRYDVREAPKRHR